MDTSTLLAPALRPSVEKLINLEDRVALACSGWPGLGLADQMHELLMCANSLKDLEREVDRTHGLLDETIVQQMELVRAEIREAFGQRRAEIRELREHVRRAALEG